MENNLENKILEKIQEVKPVPKAYFIVKNLLLWVFWFISIIIGSLAFSVISHMITNNDWDLYKYTSDNFLAFTLSTLPYLWIFLMIVFIAFAYINFVNTKGAYRYKVRRIIISSVMLSILFGFGFSYAQIGERIDKILSKTIPQYKMAKDSKESKFWNNPAKGILSGDIQSVNEQGFVLKCCCGYDWDITGVDARPYFDNGITKVRVVGEKLEGRNFKAYDIRPVQKYKEIKEKIQQKNKENGQKNKK